MSWLVTSNKIKLPLYFLFHSADVYPSPNKSNDSTDEMITDDSDFKFSISIYQIHLNAVI